MKVRIEISDDGDEEVVIRARSLTDEVRRIYEARKSAKGLSARECEVLARAGRGENNREIAAAMELSENTVKMFMKRAFFKLGATSRAEAVRLAGRRGLIPEQ